MITTIPPGVDPKLEENLIESPCPNCGEMICVAREAAAMPVTCAKCRTSFTPRPWANNSE